MATARTPGTTATRRPPRPGRGSLLGATAMVVIGSFLPWIYTALESISGARGGGLWTFYAAMLGLAGAIVPWRRAAIVQALILAVVAVGISTWQLVRAVSLLGLEGGWLPGPGLVLVFGGGVLAAVSARRIAAA